MTKPIVRLRGDLSQYRNTRSSVTGQNRMNIGKHSCIYDGIDGSWVRVDVLIMVRAWPILASEISPSRSLSLELSWSESDGNDSQRIGP